MRVSKFVVFSLLLLPCAPAMAAGDDLTDLPLEELMSITVTSAAKRPEPLIDTPAAIFVLTHEDIERSGVTNIVDALRLVPGVDAAAINGTASAVSVRGFNSRFANKVLVLIDGRSVYTPLFSGVFWDQEDLVLDNIERIEVIRGPGASVWGANAVNGVINIITRSSKATQGAYAHGWAGSTGDYGADLQFGGMAGKDLSYRVFAKGVQQDGRPDATGNADSDRQKQRMLGFRSDWDASPDDAVDVAGSYFDNSLGQSFPVTDMTGKLHIMRGDTTSSGGYLRTRWQHRFSASEDMVLSAYVDHTDLDDRRVAEKRDTVDIDFQHHFRLGGAQDIVWGAAYRSSSDRLADSMTIGFDRLDDTFDLVSGFVQDEIALLPETLHLTLGSKFEHNSYTGLEVQPTVRLMWDMAAGQRLWAAVSRAARTPSRAETSVRVVNPLGQGADVGGPLAAISATLPPGVIGAIAISGSDTLQSERLTAYEAGYRFQAGLHFSGDIAVFYNDYNRLITLQPGNPIISLDPYPMALIPLGATNMGKAHSWGFEAVANWQPREWWRLQLAYSHLKEHADSAVLAAGQSPQSQFVLRSLMTPDRRLHAGATLRYVGALPALHVADYLTADLRLAWLLTPHLEIAVSGRNLLDGRHMEFDSETVLSTVPTDTERSVLFSVKWQM